MPLFEVYVNNRRLRTNFAKYVFAKDEQEAMEQFGSRARQANKVAEDNEVILTTNLQEVKELVLKQLLTEYKKDEAEQQVNTAKITLTENIVTVTYDNNVVDKYQIITHKELKHLKD